MWDAIYPYLAALLPTAGLLVIAYVVFKTIFEADRKERKAVAEWEASKAATNPQAGTEHFPDADTPADTSGTRDAD